MEPAQKSIPTSTTKYIKTTRRDKKHLEPVSPPENASLVITQFVSSSLAAKRKRAKTCKTENMEELQVHENVTPNQMHKNKVMTVDYTAVEIKQENMSKINEDLKEPPSTDAGSKDCVYACKYCPQVFAAQHYLLSHARNSHVCKYCTRAFVKLPDLHKHLKEEHKYHVCAVCKRAMSSNRILRQHIERAHGIVLPADASLLDYRVPDKVMTDD